MITLLYNLADTYFVGQLNDPNQTAAVTIAATPFLMLTAISNLFGEGGASLLACSLGKKDPEKAGRVATISFYGGLMIDGISLPVSFWFYVRINRELSKIS